MLIIDIKVFFDIGTMQMNIKVYLFRIKIITIKIDLFKLTYRINRKKDKHLKLILNSADKYLVSQIKSNILNKLYYDSADINVELNLLDPALTARVIGGVLILLNVSNYYFVKKNNEFVFTYSYLSDFNALNNKLSFKFRVYFTVFDMVYAIILSLYKRGKYAKERG